MGVQHVSCKFLDPSRVHIFHIALFCFSYLLPLCLICGLYIRMLTRLWRNVVGGNKSADSHRGRKRATKLVVIVVFAFAGCWFPIQVYCNMHIFNVYGFVVHIVK